MSVMCKRSAIYKTCYIKCKTCYIKSCKNHIRYMILAKRLCLNIGQYKSYRLKIKNVQGGSNITGTNSDLFTHNQSRSYLNHLVDTCCATGLWKDLQKGIEENSKIPIIVSFSHRCLKQRLKIN